MFDMFLYYLYDPRRLFRGVSGKKPERVDVSEDLLTREARRRPLSPRLQGATPRHACDSFPNTPNF